jgi:hypothetical protein
MPGSSTTPGRVGTRVFAPARIAFRLLNGVGSRERVFRGSMAGLCNPLPTLRHFWRTARGRCGSLILHRRGLSPLTPCRFNRRTQQHPSQTIFPRCSKRTLCTALSAIRPEMSAFSGSGKTILRQLFLPHELTR